MMAIHVNTTQMGGGAATAANRLLAGLRAEGCTVSLLAGLTEGGTSGVAEIRGRDVRQNALGVLTRKLGLVGLENTQTLRLDQHPWVREADVLHLHNLHGNYLNYFVLRRLTRVRPVVWTLHDMWAFTGHCAYSFDCERWRTGCGRCPYPETYPAIERDATRIEWLLKRWIYRRSELTILAPSRWLADLAQQSMLSHFRIEYVSNALDTDVYRPLDRRMARAALGLPVEGRVVLTVAADLRDPRKGGDLMTKAMAALSAQARVGTTVVTMGDGGATLARSAGMPVVSLGYIGGDRLKALAYSAADLLVFPTRADNQPLVLQESMACGTPMVSFRVGGVPELVREGETGLLADPEDAEGLARCVAELLADEPRRRAMGQRCREIAEAEYRLDVQAKRMITIYEQAIEQWRSRRRDG